MKTSDAGVALIQQFEGCKLKAYQDVVGIWTIGYGHTGAEVHAGQQITQEEADTLLRQDLTKFEECVDDNCNTILDQNEFDALVCFSYNVGCGSFKNSTLLKLIHEGKKDEAAEQFLRWNKAGGKEVAGLTRRREAERALFLKSEVQSSQVTTKSNSLFPDGPSDAEINQALDAIEKGVKMR